MTLGEKVAKQRKELNYTQEQLADILGVSRQSISKWESDIAYPETDKLIELGKLFNCSMDYLLKEEVTEKSGVQTQGFTEKVEKISAKVLTDRNKGKAKKILKIESEEGRKEYEKWKAEQATLKAQSTDKTA